MPFPARAPGPLPSPGPRVLPAWSSRSHGAGAAVSTMELAAWCRWGLLLALLPPGAASTQGGSGVGGVGSCDATLPPGDPPRGAGGPSQLPRAAGPRHRGAREGGAGGDDTGAALDVPFKRLALCRLRDGSGTCQKSSLKLFRKFASKGVLHGVCVGVCVCVFPFFEPSQAPLSKPFQLAASASRLDWAGFLGVPSAGPLPAPFRPSGLSYSSSRQDPGAGGVGGRGGGTRPVQPEPESRGWPVGLPSCLTPGSGVGEGGDVCFERVSLGPTWGLCAL